MPIGLIPWYSHPKWYHTHKQKFGRDDSTLGTQVETVLLPNTPNLFHSSAWSSHPLAEPVSHGGSTATEKSSVSKSYQMSRQC
jgi:hypothetical protein